MGGGRNIKDPDMISYCMQKMLYAKYQNDKYSRFLNELLPSQSCPLRDALVLSVSRMFSLEEGWISMFSFQSLQESHARKKPTPFLFLLYSVSGDTW